MNILAEIHHRARTWTVPVVSSSIIHAAIVVGTLWLAIHWEPRAIFVEPLTLLEREPAPAPRTPPPPEPPRKPIARPVPPPPPPETPKPRPEPEIARPAPPPEPVRIPDPPAPVAEPPKPAPVVAAPAPSIAQTPQVETKPPEPTAPETKKETGNAAANGVVALAPSLAPSGPAPAAPSAPGTAGAPAPSQAAPGPLVVARAGEVSRPARPTGGYQVVPSYPAAARQQRIEGTTMLKVLVLADGRVGTVAVQKSAGHPDLDRAAADAVRQWHFDPARKGSEAVAMWVLLPVEFHLKD